MNRDRPDPEALAPLLEGVRQRHAEALEPLGPRPAGCPVCIAWRPRGGERRHPDGHVCGCALRGLTRCPSPEVAE